MDGLMSEATDLILSSGRNLVIGPNKVLKMESGKVEHSSQDSASLSSVTLLRLSITNSIKDRSKMAEVADDKTSNPNKNKRCKEFNPRNPKVDIELLNPGLITFYPERPALVDEKVNQNVHLERNKLNEPTDAFIEPLSKTDAFHPEITCNFQTQQTEIDGNKKKGIGLEDEEQKDRKKKAQNGMKLARRKFSDGIFENCSTYSLTCSEVLLERENDINPKQDSVDSNNQPLEKLPKVDDSYVCEGRKSENSEIGTRTDDQISLSDSFFVNVTSDDCVSQNSFFHKETENSSGNRKSVKCSLSKENDPAVSVSEDISYENDVRLNRKSERRISKKWRKRNKKNKSKDSPTYECPKCGVLYVLSTNASSTSARCLHCDFWTSVDPVFLKTEKQPWNTCRIC